MAYRNKTYVCFDADNDFQYYKEMLEWKANDNIDFNFYDAHDLNNLRDDSNEETIKRKLRERFNDTKLLIVLVGDVTKNLYKYVRWEIEVALNLEIPIIAANITDNQTKNHNNHPPILRNELVLNVQFHPILLQHSIDNWIDEHNKLKKKEEINNRIWKEHIYQNLGLK
jgi:hypothetical protein